MKFLSTSCPKHRIHHCNISLQDQQTLRSFSLLCSCFRILAATMFFMIIFLLFCFAGAKHFPGKSIINHKISGSWFGLACLGPPPLEQVHCFAPIHQHYVALCFFKCSFDFTLFIPNLKFQKQIVYHEKLCFNSYFECLFLRISLSSPWYLPFIKFVWLRRHFVFDVDGKNK